MAVETLVPSRISHDVGHDVRFVGVLASPERYPEAQKPTAVMNGPFIEVIGPERELHRYIMPRVLKEPSAFNTPDINVFSILEVEENSQNDINTQFVQEIDLTTISGREDLNFEDIRLQTFNLPSIESPTTGVNNGVPKKIGVEIGEYILCGVTAVDHAGVPYVALVRMRPILVDGKITFDIQKEDIQVTDFFGKNAWPLGPDLVMFRREWTRETENKKRKKRKVNRNTFSYLKRNADGEWEDMGVEKDNVLPQELIGEDGRYGLVGGDPICINEENQDYVMLFHEFQNITPPKGRIDRLKRQFIRRFTHEIDILEYALVKVIVHRNSDGTWEFKKIGKKPVVVYKQADENTRGVADLRGFEKHVVYAVSSEENGSYLDIPLNVKDEEIVLARLSTKEFTDTNPEDWIDLTNDSSSDESLPLAA